MTKRLGRLLVITDESIQNRFSHEKLAALAIAGGAGLIQYRDKSSGTGAIIEKAVILKKICAEFEVPLIINDRMDVAMAAGADGVHLGQEDLPIKTARRILGPGKIIGGTAGTVDQAVRAQEDGADYVGFGHIFPTGSKAKPGRPAGLDGLAEVCAAVDVPVYAIGGLSAATAPAVIRAGAWGLAVISAVCAREDPQAAAAEIIHAIDCELKSGCHIEHNTDRGDIR
jgi:thiamine-phosphate pyrophosphorylase